MPSEEYTDEHFEEWAQQVEQYFIDVDRISRFVNDLRQLCDNLQNEDDPSEYMTHFYNAAKSTFDGDKSQIRTWFTWLYLVVFQQPEGPRWGEFVQIYGVDEFNEKIRRRLFDISYMGAL